MGNPWEKIELSDYENHMSLESVYQLQVLNQMMGEQFEAYDIDTIMILGIAGGNGLEHIDKSKIKKVYGVDVNQEFLAECKKRYESLEDVLETIRADLADANFVAVLFLIVKIYETHSHNVAKTQSIES